MQSPQYRAFESEPPTPLVGIALSLVSKMRVGQPPAYSVQKLLNSTAFFAVVIVGDVTGAHLHDGTNAVLIKTG